MRETGGGTEPDNGVRGRHARVRQNVAGAWTTVRAKAPGQVQFWLIALAVGAVAGTAAVGFRVAINGLQNLVYGADDAMLASHAAGLHWSWVVAIPILGGLIVGQILTRFTDDGRSQSVAHVIEGAALNGGRLETRAGVASALASLVTLGMGGSTGREGPVVHLGAVIASWVSARIDAGGMTGRALMGCAVAAAVSASFNAPIAGAIFALEVVLRHYAVRAFAPIAIASVAGTVVSRLQMGDFTEFILPAHTLGFYVELPAFVLLGLLCGTVAATVTRSAFWAEDMGDRLEHLLHLPPSLRPALAGAVLGAIAVFFPHIIGVGYQTTSLALTAALPFWTAVGFTLVKAAAFAVTLAGRMGGGVFSPALMIGALTGLAFGQLATGIFPMVSGAVGLYALAGMAAVSAGVLGAPISTTLIVFEMTGDWQAGLAVLVSVSTAAAVTSRMVARSFFLTQIERRGLHIAAGPQAYLPVTLFCGALMRTSGAEDCAPDGECAELMKQGAALAMDDTLDRALPLFDRSGASFLPVTRKGEDGSPELVGALFHVDALKALNRALAETAREEHG